MKGLSDLQAYLRGQPKQSAIYYKNTVWEMKGESGAYSHFRSLSSLFQLRGPREEGRSAIPVTFSGQVFGEMGVKKYDESFQDLIRQPDNTITYLPSRWSAGEGSRIPGA